MSKKLKYSAHIIFIFAMMISPISFGSTEKDKGKEQKSKIPERWKIIFDQEPVFNSTVHIIETGKRSNQTVILIHGLGQAGFKDWLTTIPKLEKDYHVLTLDLPGFGLSEKPEGRYSPTNYAKIIHWLVKKYASTPAIVVGHSMGGAISLRYASNFPAQVKKLILIDTAGILEKTAFIKRSTQLPFESKEPIKKFKRLAAQAKDFTNSFIEFIPLLPDFTKIISKNGKAWDTVFSGKSNLNAAVALIDENFSEAIRTLPHETHIIWGKLDNVAPLSTGIMLAGRLSNASLSIIEDAKHNPMLSHSKELNQLLLHAIENTQHKKKPSKPLISQGDVRCQKENGISYAGRYDKIVITNCTGVTLTNVAAKEVIIRDSLVEFINTKIITDNVALKIYESVLIASNSTFKGDIGIVTDGSRLDLAGVSIIGKQLAIKVGVRSQFIFSVSDISSETYQGDIHGSYRYKNTSLDKQLTQ